MSWLALTPPTLTHTHTLSLTHTHTHTHTHAPGRLSKDDFDRMHGRASPFKITDSGNSLVDANGRAMDTGRASRAVYRESNPPQAEAGSDDEQDYARYIPPNPMEKNPWA